MKTKLFVCGMVAVISMCSSSSAMEEPLHESALSGFMKEMTIGIATGIAEVFVDQPLVRMKNFLQGSRGASLVDLYRRYKGKLAQTLYRGYGANAGSMGPVTAIQMGSDHVLRSQWCSDDHDLSLSERMLAAFVGGMSSGLASCPAECTILYQGTTETSIFQALEAITKNYGLKSLYRGFWPIALRDGGFATGYLVLSGALGEALAPMCGFDSTNALAKAFVGGIPAGIFAGTLTHPCDTISTLMKGDLARSRYANTWVTMSAVIKEDGLRRFYSGYCPRMLRMTFAIPLMTFVSGKLHAFVGN